MFQNNSIVHSLNRPFHRCLLLWKYQLSIHTIGLIDDDGHTDGYFTPKYYLQFYPTSPTMMGGGILALK